MAKKKAILVKEDNTLLTEVPYIHNRDELQEYLLPLYIVDDYLKDKQVYSNFMTKMMNILKGCYPIKVCREWPIKFKFYKSDKTSYTLEFRHFCINMILWEPFIEISELKVLNKDYIMDCYNIADIEDYINEKIIQTLRDAHVRSTVMNYSLSEVLYNLRKISLDFSLILGLNFSLKTFMDMYQNNSRIKELMEVSFDTGIQPAEIEERLHSYEKEFCDILKDDKKNPVGIILSTGQGIKTKQLTEFAISQGLKPTLNGETIPIPINNSTILRGANTPSSYYLSAINSRKSLVSNKKVMGRAGYFGKIVLLLARTLKMSMEVSDCGSKHLVEYEIKNKKALGKLNGKYFKMNYDDPDFKLLKAKKRKDLIGKKILVRSVATCALPNDCVCPRCVGYTASTNLDIADGLSGYESEEITKVVNQNILSTKHLLATNSETIEFTDEFYNYFNVISGEITPNVNNNEHIDYIENYAIKILPEDIEKVDEMDDDSLYNTYISTGRFYIVNLENPEESPLEIGLKEYKEIYIAAEASEIMKKNKGLIPFSQIDDDTKLFEVIVYNRELTAPLYSLMAMLNKSGDKDVNESINSISQKMLDILVEAGIGANVIAAELIINRLIRKESNIYERPDFSRDTLEPYTIVTVSKALEKNKSPLVGLSFQNIKRQILSDDLYDIRDGSSYLDAFYKTEISTDRYKEYAEIVRTEEGEAQL